MQCTELQSDTKNMDVNKQVEGETMNDDVDIKKSGPGCIIGIN